MEIKRIIVGPLETNCYIIIKNNEALIIDPGDEAEKIEEFLGNATLKGILITHSHFDHIGALPYFEQKYNLKHNTNIPNFNYIEIPTPGHKEDSITFYFPEEKVMFVGDFIFQNSIGRMDLKGGNILEMQRSLELIQKYDDDIILYPGHGNATTLGKEKENFKFYF